MTPSVFKGSGYSSHPKKTPYVSGPTGNRTRISATPGRCRPVGPSARCLSGPAGESNPDPLVAGQVSSRWTSRRCFKRSVRELNPVFLLTTEVCRLNTYRPIFKSDPGWNRTIVLLHVTQASLPLDYGTMLSVTRVGVEPTKSSRSRRDRFACLRTQSSSSGSGCCTRRSEHMTLRWTLVHPRQVAGPGIEPGTPAV